MKLIPLSQHGKNKGKYFAQVDDVDYDFLMQWNWSVEIQSHTCYAMRNDYSSGKKKTIKMHRVILGITNPNLDVDHIDHNGINNQRENIRIGTQQQNIFNTSKSKNKKSSIYIGVHLFQYSRNGRTFTYWRASINFNRRRIEIGLYKNEVDAAIARDKKARELFGEWANLNFPN